MKRLLLASLVMAGWASFAFGEVKVLMPPTLTFYPTRNTGRIARIAFETTEKGSYLVLIRDGKGQLVRCLATGAKEAGRIFVDWDGKDSLGAVVPEGTYKASLTSGLTWELDKSFGKDGRIGRFNIVQTVDDPEKMEMPFQGEIISVKVNDTEYYRADDLAIAGMNYAVTNGVLQVNPLGGAKKGDKLIVDYYYPAFFKNPWDVAVDDDGSLFVLLRIPDKYPASKLLKVMPDGKGPDKAFGDNGIVGPFTAPSQILLSPQEKRIYIAGSQGDCYQTGVFSLNTGAFLYAIGGYGGWTKEDNKTTTPAGICLGKDNVIYIHNMGSLSIYDRTKEVFKGFIASGVLNGQLVYPPIWGVYWGPSVEGAIEDAMFYVATNGANIHKIKDGNHVFADVYFTEAVPGNPIGPSLDRKTCLLFAALRTTAGEVIVFSDDGLSLKEAARLKDAELGPTHAVRYKDGNLYVLEDGVSLPAGDVLEAMKKASVNPQGKNRLSRYHVAFDKEMELGAIERR